MIRLLGMFFSSVCLAIAQVTFGSGIPFRAQGTGGPTLAADFNGDGKPDIAVLEAAFPATFSGTVYLGRGDGSFDSGHIFGSVEASFFVTGDFNGDGRLDLATATDASGTVTILLGKGDGTFTPAGSFQLSGGIGPMAAADWNGDRKTDLAVASRNTATLNIFTSRGDGSFQSGPVYSLPTQSSCAIARDLNRDGKGDIAIAGGLLLGPSSNGWVSIFLGNGDGTFKTLDPVATVYAPDSMAIADFNGDGNPDVALSGSGGFPYYNGVIEVLSGAGDGRFTSVFNSPDADTSSGPHYAGIVAADFSRDGNVDLIARSGAQAVFLAGNGDNSFQDIVTVVPAIASNVIAADVNGDGKPDLVSSDSVYLNTTPSTAPIINPGGVVNAASSMNIPAAPGSLISIYGTDLSLPSADLTNTRLLVHGIPMPLLYASPGQLNAQVPWELSGQTKVSLGVSVAGVTGPAGALNVAPYSPGLFQLDAAGHGAVLIATPGIVYAAPSGLFPGSRPVNRGESIQIFGTGFGQVSNQPRSGEASPFNPLAESLVRPSVDLGGVAAEVTYSGLAPGLIGVYQINASVPANVPTGDAIALKSVVGGVESNTVLIAIR